MVCVTIILVLTEWPTRIYIYGCIVETGLKMSGFHLFKKLGIGAKFDLKRFKNDAERLCVSVLVISFRFIMMRD